MCGDGYERGLVPLSDPIASAAQDSEKGFQFDARYGIIVLISLGFF